MNGKTDSTIHSIWLMPAIEDRTMLAGLVDGLAETFGTPVFQPHLTLVEDMPRAAGELMPLVEKVAAGVTKFAAPVTAIGSSDLYFRSLFARFEAVEDILLLKKRAIETIAPSPMEQFMPHISLAYGVEPGPAKDEAIERVSNFLVRRPIHFDQLAVVTSGQAIPIEDWRVAASITLR